MLKGLENGKKGSGSIKLKGELTVHFNCENTEKKILVYTSSLFRKKEVKRNWDMSSEL